MGCKELISSFFHYTDRYISGKFRWVYCQLDYLSKCIPARVEHALDELPVTLDETYEGTLHEIGDANWEYARRLIQCVAVVSRPLRVDELAEFLAFDFKAGQIPTFREDWHPEDPVEAVLSTCSTLLSLINVKKSKVIQFSHFSVKEFLTSARFGEKCSTISSRYHISMTPAHTRRSSMSWYSIVPRQKYHQSHPAKIPPCGICRRALVQACPFRGRVRKCRRRDETTV